MRKLQITYITYCKTFDSLEHSFIVQDLTKFGFGELFSKTIKTLYKNNGSC